MVSATSSLASIVAALRRLEGWKRVHHNGHVSNPGLALARLPGFGFAIGYVRSGCATYCPKSSIYYHHKSSIGLQTSCIASPSVPSQRRALPTNDHESMLDNTLRRAPFCTSAQLCATTPYGPWCRAMNHEAGSPILCIPDSLHRSILRYRRATHGLHERDLYLRAGLVGKGGRSGCSD